MQVTAKAKNIRVSPQKMRLVVDQIKKMEPQKSIAILNLLHKSSAAPLKKVIASAIANAKNNFGLDEGTLTFKSILVGRGPMSKRYQPIARGRTHPILKRTSHITVILEGEQRKPTTTENTSQAHLRGAPGRVKAHLGGETESVQTDVARESK